MEEKKKRWRPSLTQYRELQTKLDEQIEGTSLIVADCHGWRAKYRSIIEEISKGNDKKVLRDHIEALECENKALRHSNEMMETELDKMRASDNEFARENRELRDEVFYLRNRGFWARVFNR